jgi:hypothetical protein
MKAREKLELAIGSSVEADRKEGEAKMAYHENERECKGERKLRFTRMKGSARVT